MLDFINENKDYPDNRIAVLIDAENVPCSYIKAMLEEIARYGTPTIKRIYADWTSPCVNAWKGVLLENAITPIQQYSYTHGKNSSDSAMIIDAMDLLYSNDVDTFCIVSSDSDFTRLATRLREAGKKVLGIGEKKTPEAFIVSCDKFVFLEILAPKKKPVTQDRHANKKPIRTVVQKKKTDANKTSVNEAAAVEVIEGTPAISAAPFEELHDKNSVSGLPEDIIELLATSVNDLADDDGWAFLGDIGNLLLKKRPSFDSRNFGFQKLTPMFAATGLFDIDRRQTANPAIKHIYIRTKNS